VDWQAIMPELDFVNLMTYDLTNGYSKVTGHHTPLHCNKKQKESTSHCVNWLLNHNVPAQKLIIGAAFYARVWEFVPNATNGLYQNGNFKAGVAYKQFSTYFTEDKGFKYYFDKKSQAPYQYSSKEKLFATFDDERSIAAKSKFIKNKKLGGIMFWELGEDKEQGGLVDAIYKNLKGNYLAKSAALTGRK
jgi:chitinase